MVRLNLTAEERIMIDLGKVSEETRGADGEEDDQQNGKFL